VPDQDGIEQLFRLDDVDDVGDVGVERDGLWRQMRAFADAAQ
jgi:hypothetical protein